MNETTITIDGGATITAGLTERAHTPYLSIGFPHLLAPHDEGPDLFLYRDDARELAATVNALADLSAQKRAADLSGPIALVNPAPWTMARQLCRQLADQLDGQEPLDRGAVADLIACVSALDV